MAAIAGQVTDGGDEILSAMTTRVRALRLETHFVTTEPEICGQAEVYLPDDVWVRWSANTNDQQPLPPYRLRLQLQAAHETNAPLWQKDIPLVRNGSPFSIPMRGRPQGSYRVIALALDPAGQAHPVVQTTTNKYGSVEVRAEAPLTVMDPYSDRIETVVMRLPKVVSVATKLGEPTRRQFPADTAADAEARGIIDLHRFKGRIYVGCGDIVGNRGPIKIWSFPEDTDSEVEFSEEFTVDDEAVRVFRDDGRVLYVPGADSSDEDGDQWALGNVYLKQDGKWSKRRTVPNALHVLDFRAHEGRLYATAVTQTGGALFASDDDGQSWMRFRGTLPGDWGFFEMLPFNGKLMVTPQNARQGIYSCDGESLRHVPLHLFPGSSQPNAVASRLVCHGKQAVYTILDLDQSAPQPLYCLSDLETGARRITAFSDSRVRRTTSS
jgi:hypothetical protein